VVAQAAKMALGKPLTGMTPDWLPACHAQTLTARIAKMTTQLAKAVSMAISSPANYLASSSSL